MSYRSILGRTLCLVLLLLTIAPRMAGTTSAAALHKVTLWLDWYPNTDHAGIYVAIAKGFYAQEGLQVNAQVPSGAADAVKLVTHGSGDIGISYEPTVLLARQQSIPVTAVGAIVQKPLNCVLTLSSSGITRPRQLAGHTVGMAGEASDYTDLQALMQHDGGQYHKVKTVVVNYSLLQSLLTKKVDAIIGAYWTWEALQAKQQGYKVNSFRLDQWGIPTYNELVFITGPSQLKSEPATLRAFLRATYRGYAYAAAHPAETASILLKVPGVLSSSRALLEQSLSLLAPLFKDAKGHYGPMNVAQWQAYANWMTANHLISGHLQAAPAVSNALLP